MLSVRGYIDRIENEKMVIIAETLEREFVIDNDPSIGLLTGDWVVLTLEKDEIVTNIQRDDETTAQHKARIKQLKQTLRRRR